MDHVFSCWEKLDEETNTILETSEGLTRYLDAIDQGEPLGSD